MKTDLAGLTALLSVAEKRSFTAAAAELRVTPSAVSQTVRALEERVGVRLLQRTTRSVGLTEAGERFVARLKPAVTGVEEAFEALEELRGRPAGTLRLTLPRVGYEQVLAPQLAVEATAPDGTIEAVSVKGARGFAMGFQWHPEYRAADNPDSVKLFEAFGTAARVYAARPRTLRRAS